MKYQETKIKINFSAGKKMNNVDTLNPLPMTDKYYIGIYSDGSSKLINGTNKCKDKFFLVINFNCKINNYINLVLQDINPSTY